MLNALFKLSIYFLLSGLLLSCNKPDPQSYKRDPIYQDILAELALANGALAQARSDLETHKQSVAKAIPQTGQIKYAQKRFWQATERVTKAEQMVRYWEIRASSRKSQADRQYLRSFYNKTPWPDQKEFDEYSKNKLLSQRKRIWNLRERFTELGYEYPDRAAASQSAPKAAAKPPSEH